MSVKFRRYNDKPGFSEDFHKVRDFLIRINSKEFVCINYLWERWEWTFCLEAIKTEDLCRIGIWEDGNKIIAVTTLEDCGEIYPLIDTDYSRLQEDVIRYSCEYLSKDGKALIMIQDDDEKMQKAAQKLGLYPTQHKDLKSVIDICSDNLAYTLPDGFRITSLADEYNLSKYNSVLWKGFNHGDEPPEDEEQLRGRKVSLSGPHQDLNLNIAVVSPEGEFVSYCGMWYDSETDYALVEPVATVPAYRKMGLGKAAVLEGVRRCGELGAKRAYVGSSQQFYYKIGFRPVPGGTFWELD
jgi:GNAT superfamily N-acetyltransferase